MGDIINMNKTSLTKNKVSLEKNAKAILNKLNKVAAKVNTKKKREREIKLLAIQERIEASEMENVKKSRGKRTIEDVFDRDNEVKTLVKNLKEITEPEQKRLKIRDEINSDLRCLDKPVMDGGEIKVIDIECRHVNSKDVRCTKTRKYGDYCTAHRKSKPLTTVKQMVEEARKNSNIEAVNIGFHNFKTLNKILDFDDSLLDKFINFVDEKEGTKDDLETLYFKFLEDSEIKKEFSILKKLRIENEKLQSKIEYTTTTIIDNFDTEPKPVQIMRKEDNIDDNDVGYYKSTDAYRMYVNPPWFPFKVKHMYIIPSSDSDNSDISIESILPYIHVDNTYENEGVKWYKINVKFLVLLTKTTSFNKKQTGDVFSISTAEGVLSVKIGYQIENGFVIQDENLYNLELKYIKQRNMVQSEKVAIMSLEVVNNDVINKAASLLSKSLLDITNLNSLYMVDTKYIKVAIDTIKSSTKNIKEFSYKLSDLLVYLNGDVIALGNNVFIKRIISGYYLPEVIVNLSPEDKLPEIFNNNFVSDKTRDEVATMISFKIKKFTNSFMTDIYVQKNSMFSRVSSGSIKQSFDNIVRMDDIKRSCKNYSVVSDVKFKDLLLYNNNGENLCFSIDKLFAQFRNKNYTIYDKISFKEGDSVQTLVENVWINGKIVRDRVVDPYSNRYNIDIGDGTVLKDISYKKIRAGDESFPEEFVNNFMVIYNDVEYRLGDEYAIEEDKTSVVESIIGEETVESFLVPNLLELIESDINSKISSTFNIKIIKEVTALPFVEEVSEAEVEVEAEVKPEEILERDTTDYSEKMKKGNAELFRKWVESQRRINEHNLKSLASSSSLSPKKCNQRCVKCGDDKIVKTVLKTLGKNTITPICLDCLEDVEM